MQGDIVSEDMLRDKGALRLRGEEKCSSRGGSGRSELGELLLVYFDKYRRAEYQMAIAHMDFAVKPLLASWSISWVQYFHV